MWYWVSVLVSVALASGCGDSDGQPNRSLLVVVESSLYDPLEASLERYAESTRLEGIDVYVEPWVPGTVDELKRLVFEHVDLDDIAGALLVGDLPVAWYEQPDINGNEEQFPFDVYLQDRDALWVDQDNDEIFDYHSDLDLDIYTARLNGTPTELQDYFERADYYRRIGSLVDVSAFIFIDDGWSDTNTDDAFHLNELYSTVEVIKDQADSTLDNYLAKLTGDGAEFVYQKMHAAPRIMRIDDLADDGTPANSFLTELDIVGYNFKVSFVNMVNCSAARFTEPNTLAEAYTVATDYGLAIIGSTKMGHLTDPRTFHENLVQGMRWGEAYSAWYNTYGKYSDKWHLGVVIMGDPLLTLRGDLAPAGSVQGQGSGVRDLVEPSKPYCDLEGELGTFDEYRREHPEFFETE